MKRIGLIGMVAGAGLSASANGAIFTTYQDPAGDRELKYFAPTGAELFGSLLLDTTIDFQVDLTEEGLGVLTFPGATITKTAAVSDVTELVAGTVFAAEVFNADFEIRDAGNNLILSGSYGYAGEKPFGADLTMLTTSATLNANSTAPGGSLEYTVGDAISTALASQGLVAGGAVDAAWTITAITSTEINEGGFFTDFEANSAFSGTLEVLPVPTPGAIALAGLGGLAAIRRRRG